MFGKTYPCDLCKKTFSRNGDLTRHKAIHSGEKNHVCVVCGMRFAQHSGLKTHRNTHTGEKPHQCDYCGKSFGDPSSCARHEKEKHFGKPFQCRWCPSSIVRRSSFAGHLREKHPEIRHLVTKEFLDDLEGPRLLKPKNKRGRSRRSATIHESRNLAKVEPGMCTRSRALTLDNEIALPKLMEVERTEIQNAGQIETVDGKAEHDHARRNPNALSLTFGAPDFTASFAEAMMSQQAAPRYTQSPMSYQPTPQQERHPVLEPLNFDYNFPFCSGGTPQFDEASVGGFDTSSASSSPGPITPLDIKPPTAFIEPFKINPSDYSSMFDQVAIEEQNSAPPMYPYGQEQQPLLYQLGL